MRAVKEKANAKINLYLDVIAKRNDGFHDIKTIMHSISLADEITVMYSPSHEQNIRVSIKGNNFLPTDEKNLAYRAAKLYLDTANKNANIEIRLDKRIPIAAGLAGGSSDAAATLRAMNRIFGKMFSERALYKMAEQLGSDVPYCLYGKTALCESRGEIITKLPDVLKLNIVVAIANEHVSTPAAYSVLDSMYSSFDGSKETAGEKYYDRLIESIKRGQPNTDNLFNIFEGAVLPNCKGASRIKKRLLELGASSALMSGSGPSVFGIFKSENQAKQAAEYLQSENITAHYAKSV